MNTDDLNVIDQAMNRLLGKPRDDAELVRQLVRYLKLIEHATAPMPDGAYHENAYTLARQALSLAKWGVV